MEERKLIYKKCEYIWETKPQKKFPKQAQELLKYLQKQNDWVSELRYGVDGDKINFITLYEDQSESTFAFGYWKMMHIGTEDGLKEHLIKHPEAIVFYKI